jgi:hypothetical protein
MASIVVWSVDKRFEIRIEASIDPLDQYNMSKVFAMMVAMYAADLDWQ